MRLAVVLGSLLFLSVFACARPMVAHPVLRHRSLVQYDSLVAVREGGPHRGGGETTAYPFFAHEDDLALVFRKRALHPGAAIGYHQNDVDEIYYVLSGIGEITLDGVRHTVTPGAAILTRAGSFHGLRQTGSEDLVVIVNYERTVP